MQKKNLESSAAKVNRNFWIIESTPLNNFHKFAPNVIDQLMHGLLEWNESKILTIQYFESRRKRTLIRREHGRINYFTLSQLYTWMSGSTLWFWRARQHFK